eukprot:CAMPEP_0182432844 /NCGR_PEP_ID=MMETSP1167-20130531/59226_1 /TAXON_ID=2988 /ORGANISM="Mallomonas Sp, Strain CCMP3275" /LENGTH=608 /DNA_ID=CAMNT_0024620831 /DNA_START=211 /DNA_END=2037 /DNA_ORIENTATION=-
MNRKVILAAIEGNMEDMHTALTSGGFANCFLTEEMGRSMGLGEPWVDFLPIPALHMAIGKGTEGHYQASSLLIDAGADPNAYREGCPPAVLFALGFAQAPNDGMGATLQALFRNPDQRQVFEIEQSILDWNTLQGYTHNPTILHYAISNQFSLGVNVLVSDGQVDINAPDKYQITPLHYACYLCQSEVVGVLIHLNAELNVGDEVGRNPLHYAAMRGCETVLSAFLNGVLDISEKKLKRMLMKRDDYGYTPLDLASLSPPIIGAQKRIIEAMSELGILSEEDEEQGGVLPRRVRAEQHSREGSREKARETDIQSDEWQCAAHTSLDREGPDEIDVVDFKDLSAEDLSQRYLSAQRPVLISGNMTGDGSSELGAWGIWKYMSRKTFEERYALLRLSTGIIPYAQDFPDIIQSSKNDVSLSDWLRDVRSNVTEEEVADDGSVESQSKARWIAFDRTASKQLPMLFDEDMGTPPFAMMCDGAPNSERSGIQMSIGGYGSGAPIHAHHSAWNLLLTGRKRWFLFYPGALGPRPQMWSSTKHPVSDMALFETFRAHGMVLEVTQQAGDVLFIPQGWGHATIHTCETVSVSEEFCGPRVRESPLDASIIIYGAN